jgi:hypothetical protein
MTTTIHEIVPILAVLAEKSSLPRSPAQERLIAHLKSFPEYLARRRLDEWDDNVPEGSSEDEKLMAMLLEGIYELGRSNLYAGFQRERTLREYAVVAAQFLEAGLSPPQVDAIDGW